MWTFPRTSRSSSKSSPAAGRAELLRRRDQTGPKLRAVAEKALGERPLAVVDVGALWGLLPELQPIESFVSAVGFDPDAEECERLNAAAQEGGLRQRFLPHLVAGATSGAPST